MIKSNKHDYYLKNKETIVARAKKWQKEHPQEVKEERERFLRNNPNYWKEYFKELKHWAVEKLERKCSRCGLVSKYDCIYDFHHLGKNSWVREENPTNMRIKELLKWKQADKIPDDVKLLCANCHRIEHS